MTSTHDDPNRRVAWLLNHTTLREFEVPLLRSLGYETYTGKQLLVNDELRSISADFGDDQHSTLPPRALECLNRHNFYEEEFTPEVADTLNRYFGTVFCSYFPVMLREIACHFHGRILVRAFGREKESTYSDYLRDVGGSALWRRIREIKHRFWFAPCYASIADIEEPLLRERCVTLPLGLPERIMKKQGTWTGGDNRLLFFCPRITTQAAYYGAIYQDFKRTLGEFPHLIAGSQPTPVNDPAVTGFVSEETLETWFKTLNVMFYHSREPRHLHYYPLEAIVYGMPVLYLRGGLLDALGGPTQPGACVSLREARHKTRRILGGDRALAQEIRTKQMKILETFTWDYNGSEWERLFREGVMRYNPGAEKEPAVAGNRRVAVILPKAYRGGTLRATKDLAKMLKWGSRQRGVELDVVLACRKDVYDFDSEFSEIREFGIQVRPLEWKTVTDEARTIGELSSTGLVADARHDQFALPCDGSNDFLDCDFWLFVSDRFDVPLLPIRPYGAVIFDYIQRYVPEVFTDSQFVLQAEGMIPFVREASFLIVTTPATRGDLNAYAGVPERKIFQIPLFFELIKECEGPRLWKEEYIVWVSNPTPHKNHARVLRGLEKYYDELGGKLKTILVGPEVDFFSASNDRPGIKEMPTVARVRSLISNSPSLLKNLRITGELPPAAYASAIKHARFLLHGNLYDNGTFSVIDAASLGVPSLSSRYPAMEYLNELCRLNLMFFDPYSVDDLAQALKLMESRERPVDLPDRGFLEQFHWKKSGDALCAVVLERMKMSRPGAYR